MARIPVAAIQLTAHDRGGAPGAWPAIEDRLRQCAATGARLIVLPEGTLPAYVLGSRPFHKSEIAAQLEACARIAREYACVVVIGAAEQVDGKVYNGAVVFDSDGSQAGVAHKTFLWHFDRQWFSPNERIEPIQTDAGVLGVLICADGRIPTIARTLVDRGAQILVMPTAWVTSGRDPADLENIQADLLARVRARENGVPFIAANKCGVELHCVAYCGKSQIISADGEIAALAGQHSAETIAAEIELGHAKPSRNGDGNVAASVASSGPQRFAISARRGAITPELRRITEASAAAAPDTLGGLTIADDSLVFDPGGLAELRLRGIDLVTWLTSSEPEWQLRFARARALELRIYVIVIDERRERAYALDPDGAVICGTFDGFDVAAFTFDPLRTAQTGVAPGTDVLEGLRRVAAVAASR